jgi:hypothetical protein
VGCGVEGIVDLIRTAPDDTSVASCGAPTSSPVSNVTLGTFRVDDADGGTFTPLADDDAIPLITGLQGASMIVVRIRIMGATDTACVAQRTDVNAADGRRISFSYQARAFTLQPDGSYLSRDLFLPGSYPTNVRVTTVLGGQTVTRNLRIGAP